MSEKEKADPRRSVLEALRTKSCVKQDVYERTTAMFAMLKEVVASMSDDLKQEVEGMDKRLSVAYVDRSSTACELKLAGDVIIFNMHTNIFRLDQSHNMWRGSYLREDELRGYFGVVNMYNFLSDSLTYERDRDVGYLVARLFLNKDGHFFVQGKRQLGFLFNDLAGSLLDKDKLREVLYSVTSYVIEFDLLAPPYDQVDQVTVSEMKAISTNVPPATGKRVGFRFQSEDDDFN